MSFPIDLTSVLTGASSTQLGYWRRTRLLVPEVQTRPQVLYSFRDLVALRTVVHLRRTSSLQAVRRAFAELERLDLTEHPSQYQLVSHGKSVVLVQGERQVDLVSQPGHELITNLHEVFSAFVTAQGRTVGDFRRPRPSLQVREHRMGGWPTIRGTRIPYDTIALLVADQSVRPEQVAQFYPSVTTGAVADAVDFANEVAEATPVRVAL